MLSIWWKFYLIPCNDAAAKSWLQAKGLLSNVILPTKNEVNLGGNQQKDSI